MTYISNKDFFLEVSKGNISKHSRVNKSGINLDIDTATGDSKEWKGAKLIKNIGGATSTNNIETVGSVFSDASMAACTANLYDDATPQSIECGIVGIAATTIEWKCYVNFLRTEI